MQRVAEVFTCARHLSGMERSRYLADSCGGDVFDPGSTADGRTWFAMELVPGAPITAGP